MHVRAGRYCNFSADRKKPAILPVFTELTVLLESFDLFTDLALQIPGFCLQ